MKKDRIMPAVNQATKIPGKDEYKFNGEPIPIIGAPDDTDWQRWGMLNDRKSSRMYFFREGTDNKIYPFLLKDCSYQYDDTIPLLTIEGVDDDVNSSSMSMLSTPNFEPFKGVNGKDLPVPNNYHVYMQKRDNAQEVQQFIWEKDSENLERNGITRSEFAIKNFPGDTDWERWAMTYDSNHYQLTLEAYVFFAFKSGSNTEIYYGRYGEKHTGKDGNEIDVYGYNGCLSLEGAPGNTNHSSMSMIFDGVDTHLFMLTK